MGIVYAGEHVELKTRVAIKVLHPKLAEDPTARARFLREARLAASVTGEHCTRIHDVGTDDEGQPYLVMEYLGGEPVDGRLEREGKLPVADAATIVIQLLDALAEAHARGLVHRDVKPANLFLVEKPGEPIWVKVLDFGISKVLSDGDVGTSTTSVKLTEPRTLLGSPEYMSPEQLRDSAGVDARSDLWACGVLLFELLTGKMPFESTTLADLYVKIVSGEPRSLSDVGAEGVPSALGRVIDRCLEKQPSARFASAYELAVALAPFASPSARALLPRLRAWCKGDEAAPSPTSKRMLIGGSSLVALAGVLAFVAASMRAAPGPAPAASRSVELPGLDPPVSAAPPAITPPSAAPTPPAAASTAAASSPSASSAPSQRAGRPGRPPRRAGELDGIDLIQ
jgi:serine/threonine-protein kinase